MTREEAKRSLEAVAMTLRDDGRNFLAEKITEALAILDSEQGREGETCQKCKERPATVCLHCLIRGATASRR